MVGGVGRLSNGLATSFGEALADQEGYSAAGPLSSFGQCIRSALLHRRFYPGFDPK